MTVGAGPSINMSAVFNEIGIANGSAMNFTANEAKLRELCDIPTGEVNGSDFYSKSIFDVYSACTPTPVYNSGGLNPRLTVYDPAISPADYLDVAFEVSSGGSFYTPLISDSKTALRASTNIYMKIHVVSGPTNGGSLSWMYSVDTWISLNTEGSVALTFDDGGVGVSASVTVIELSFRAGAESNSVVTKTFTVSSVAND
jgi:hypothetical protein